MHDLRKMWEVGGLVEDQNNDHVADRVNVWIDVEQDVYPDGLIDFCARLGFETTSLSFDFFEETNTYKYQLCFVQNDQQTAVEWAKNQLTVTYQDEENLSKLLRFLAGKWHVDFGGKDSHVQKIMLAGERIVLEDAFGKLEEYALDSKDDSTSSRQYHVDSLTDVWSPFGFLHDHEPSPENKQAVTFTPERGLSREAWMEIYYAAARIGMESTALAFPFTGAHSNHPFSFVFQPNDQEEASVQLEGNSVHFSGEEQSLVRAISYVFREKHWSFGGHFGAWENINRTPPPEEKMFEFTWDDQGEVEELYERLAALKKQNDSSEDMNINIFISEPKSIRDDIRLNVQKQFPQAQVVVRSAFKPGYFWLMEEVVPAIEGLHQTVDKVVITCKQEETEDGLELPIRWIQELYPVDEMISNKLGIDLENVDFECCEDVEATYNVSVYSSDHDLLYEDHIHIPVSKVPYVEEGKYSYPTTSYISVYKENQPVMDTLIQTDRERFYMYYLEEILPKLWEHVDRADKDSGFLKPLFDRIEIEAEMSEEEQKIPVEEERISSLEALHEDLYFNTLDYFVVKGEQTVGEGYTAPGGVYPFLKVTPGKKPTARIIAYKWVERQVEKVSTKRLVFTNDQKTPIKVTYHVGEEMVQEDVREDIQIDNIPAGVFRPKVARVHPWLVEYSYRGEPIFVYEFFNDVQEEYYSAIKLTAHKPTVLIETGHHANEVSSMPAVVEMMDEIAENHSDIIRNVNLVVIPRANPDGTALHERMITDNPEWKHHAARYNAVGLEFSDVRYLNSIFGEGNVVPHIMKRWAPDILIDDHGIPSHEWTQPFAGYHVPPRFHMSFWIPNAMVYGIARQLDPEKFPRHNAVLDQITTSIQRKVQHTDIQDLNDYWVNRYRKYGNRYMPEMFPIEMPEDFIFYKWPTEIDGDSRNAISRFPNWVSADILSEVADETVYGESLETCKKAHRLFDLGAIEWIDKEAQRFNRSYDSNEISLSRERPLRI